MKLQWTPNGGLLPVTLGDDAAKFAVRVERIGGQSICQQEPLAGAPNPALFPRGNVAGAFVFTSTKTYATVESTWSQFKTEYNRLNQQGTLVQTEGATVNNYVNAVLKNVERIFSTENGGSRMGIRYTFDITTIQ